MVLDPAPAQRCGSEGRGGHQEREGGNGDRNRNGGENGNEDEYGNEHEGRDEGANGNGNGDKNREEVEGRYSLGINDAVIEVGRKMLEGRRRQRVTINHSRKTRRPSEIVTSCEGPEPTDGRQGTGSRRAGEGRRSARNPRRVIDAMWKTRETWADGETHVDKKVLV